MRVRFGLANRPRNGSSDTFFDLVTILLYRGWLRGKKFELVTIFSIRDWRAEIDAHVTCANVIAIRQESN